MSGKNSKPLIVFEEKYVTISFDTSTGIVLLDWHRYATSEQFRFTLSKLLEFVESQSKITQTICLLADTANLGVITKEDIEWNAIEINPYMYQAGVRKVAFIVPKNLFTHLSINTFQKQIKTQDGQAILSEIFNDRQSAQRWLKES